MLFNDVVGHYRNRNQAFSNPSTWPQIDIRIIEPSYGILLAKSCYKYKGEEEPYNYIQYDWQRMDENIVYTKLLTLSLILLPVLSFGTGMELGGMVILMENASKVVRGWSPR